MTHPSRPLVDADNFSSVRWVIGDVHGMLGPLEELLSAIAREDRDPQLLFVGDYVNRGPDSKRVIDLLLTMTNARFCRGNHDDVLDLILHNQSYGVHPELADPIFAFTTFMRYGLDTTLESYGLDRDALEKMESRPSHKVLDEIRAAVPEPHKKFIRGLPGVIEDFDLFVAHALWHPEVPTDSPDIETRLRKNGNVRRSIIWGRFNVEQIEERKIWMRTGYFGHTPVEVYPGRLRDDDNIPIVAHQIVLLDTGCALGMDGRLTACCADANLTLQVTRTGETLVLRP